MKQNQDTIKREIKSYVLRQGKITQGQSNAIQQLLPKYGIEYQSTKLSLNDTFGRSNPKIIEIGFGMGHATWQIAKNNPENDYLGIEVHLPGVGSLLMQVEDNQIANLRVIRHDAVEVIKHMIPDSSINGFHIFFPDPWHKKRHHKRRIIQDNFIQLLTNKLTPNGYIHVATDWEDYAHWILEIMQNHTPLINSSLTNDYVPRPEYRPLTKFENRGLNLGHKVWDLIFTKG